MEGQYLDSIYPYTEEYYTDLQTTQVEVLKCQYNIANKTKVGQVMKCPYCGKQIRKKSYQHKFCNTKCKDKYWNIVNPRGIMK